MKVSVHRKLKMEQEGNKGYEKTNHLCFENFDLSKQVRFLKNLDHHDIGKERLM
jgi:hypothetical protein